MVGGRPQYPAEETEKAEIIDECENVTPECDDISGTVCLITATLGYLYRVSLLKLISHHKRLATQTAFSVISDALWDLCCGKVFIFSCFICNFLHDCRDGGKSGQSSVFVRLIVVCHSFNLM